MARLSCAVLVVLASSCTYLKFAAVQAEYARLQEAEPSQRLLKHMIVRQNFAVIGRTYDPQALYVRDDRPMAVAAFCSRFRPNELVDVMHDLSAGTHFGLDLPGGDYRVVVFSDIDRDGRYRSDEAIGESSLRLTVTETPALVATRHQVPLSQPFRVGWNVDLPVLRSSQLEPSVFFPGGTIRSLDDPIFADEMATLGLYDPAAFLARAPTFFYALEEELGHKIPVIFVHGIDGTPRQFEALVDSLDRKRFKPWFFFYPSGGDLNQLAEVFYEIFFSGDQVQHNGATTVIVAHSMGGLVVREALNIVDPDETRLGSIELVTLATPFGGHPSADFDEIGDILILPSWRDLDSNGRFLGELFRRCLPRFVRHHLLYAFSNDAFVKLGVNSDGVVPLSSQLHPPAQRMAASQLGVDATHTGILGDADAIAALRDILGGLASPFPESHMVYLRQGGFEVPDPEEYTAVELYFVRTYGRYLRALANGEIDPCSPWERELKPMLLGEMPPTWELPQAWIKFTRSQRARSDPEPDGD